MLQTNQHLILIEIAMYIIEDVETSELQDHYTLNYIIKEGEDNIIALCETKLAAELIVDALNHGKQDKNKLKLVLNAIILQLDMTDIHDKEFVKNAAVFGRDIGIGMLDINNVVNLLRVIAKHDTNI